jgi:hypothetical protein
MPTIHNSNKVCDCEKKRRRRGNKKVFQKQSLSSYSFFCFFLFSLPASAFINVVIVVVVVEQMQCKAHSRFFARSTFPTCHLFIDDDDDDGLTGGLVAYLIIFLFPFFVHANERASKQTRARPIASENETARSRNSSSTMRCYVRVCVCVPVIYRHRFAHSYTLRIE